jgi:hypothetical protein
MTPGLGGAIVLLNVEQLNRPSGALLTFGRWKYFKNRSIFPRMALPRFSFTSYCARNRT